MHRSKNRVFFVQFCLFGAAGLPVGQVRVPQQKLGFFFAQLIIQVGNAFRRQWYRDRALSAEAPA